MGHCERRLPVDCDAVLNLRVLVLGEDVPRHQLGRSGVGAFGDNAIGLVVGDARKRSQIIFGTLVQIDGAAFAQSIFHAFSDGLGVTLDGRGFFGGFLAKLIRALIRAGRIQSEKRCKQRGEEESLQHGIPMPRTGARLARPSQIAAYFPARRSI